MSRVPQQASGGSGQPGQHELEQLEELGDDAIIAQQQAAHAPQPRVQVTEEARSVVISEHSNPPNDARASAPGSGKKRSDRTEKTVVIRDRRQVDELRRQMAARKPKPAPPASSGMLLWVVVGVAAFVLGGIVALFATREDAAASAAPSPTVSAPAAPSAAPVVAPAEPPKVSIDELPIEGSKKK